MVLEEVNEINDSELVRRCDELSIKYARENIPLTYRYFMTLYKNFYREKYDKGLNESIPESYVDEEILEKAEEDFTKRFR